MMKKLLLLLFLFSVTFMAGLSLALDLRVVRIEKFLAVYCPKSPLIGRGEELVRYADEFGLDYRLYLAIAGAESGFGRRYPKRKHNLTGILNGETRFKSISDNIRYTNQLIAEGKWYRRYRETHDLRDLVVIFKAVPPYENYLRTLRFVLHGINEISVEKEYRAEHPIGSPVETNALRYDQITPRRVIRNPKITKKPPPMFIGGGLFVFTYRLEPAFSATATFSFRLGFVDGDLAIAPFVTG